MSKIMMAIEERMLDAVKFIEQKADIFDKLLSDENINTQCDMSFDIDLLNDNNRYEKVSNLQFAICEFAYNYRLALNTFKQSAYLAKLEIENDNEEK